MSSLQKCISIKKERLLLRSGVEISILKIRVVLVAIKSFTAIFLLCYIHCIPHFWVVMNKKWSVFIAKERMFDPTNRSTLKEIRRINATIKRSLRDHYFQARFPQIFLEMAEKFQGIQRFKYHLLKCEMMLFKWQNRT